MNGLLRACPRCRQPLKHNLFIVDKRGKLAAAEEIASYHQEET
jgi:hypothetical protein